MVKQEYKVDPKALRKIAINKFGCNVVASLDDEEVKDKVMKDYVLIQELSTNSVYLIAKSQLSECISLESEK
ncbi:MAG: hypothetical protein IKO49_03800 [Bacilli bacterium]|nr:hypothetical protein [Clostridia bacterium]MBR4618410.1 hypothetical protein [Bacilli bacterium]